MVPFLAQSVPSVEQAAKGLADQTWNQPVTWWLSLFLFLAIGALSFVLWRGMKKDDEKDERIEEMQTNQVALAGTAQKTADNYATLSVQIINILTELARKVDRAIEILIKIAAKLSSRKERDDESD
jgi:membrane protein implicated in regulation of membrane protease activity